MGCVSGARYRVADASAASVARHHGDARLAPIAWELRETTRKYAWAFRHESTGSEHDGWLRGMARIDGRCSKPSRRRSASETMLRTDYLTGGAMTGTAEPRLEDVAARAGVVLDEIERAVVGKRAALELALSAMLADGHVLIEDYPGLAKTLIARSFATVTGTKFSRVQFTPDLMPSDITGASIFNQRSSEFEFRPGPVFTNVLLADEINRAPPKTQAALLEAMQERQVTSEDRTRRLERPFLVLATQNPIEYEGTYPLPEAQLDRFLIRMRVGYPSRDDEWDILARRLDRRDDEAELRPIVDREELIGMQRAAEKIHVSEAVGRYIVELVSATRESPSVSVGASPRGSLALMKLARVKALLDGRDFVVPDDVKAVAVPTLAHRLALRPELWVQRVAAEDVVLECMRSIPVPTTGATH